MVASADITVQMVAFTGVRVTRILMDASTVAGTELIIIQEKDKAACPIRTK